MPNMTIRLKVTGLKKDTTRDDLLAMFSPFGEVIGAKALSQYNGPGFVDMARVIDALLAIAVLDGTRPYGKRLRVQIAPADLQPDYSW